MLRWLMGTIFVNGIQLLINKYQENKVRGGGGMSVGLVGRRIAAMFIDWIPVLIVAAIAQAVLLGTPNLAVMQGSFATAFTPLVFLVVVAYFSLFEGYLGFTPGKYVVGVRVHGVEEEGPPGLQAAFIRSALRTVDGLLGYLVGLVAMLFSEEQRRIGDRVAGTVTTGAGSPLAGLGGSTEGGAMGATAFSGGGSLGGYARDLTAQAKKGRLEPVIGREQEVKQVVRTLGRSSKNNPVLVGEAGVGKTAVAEGLARIAAGLEGEAPAALKGKKIVELDITAIDSGTIYRGMFEERMQEVIRQASRPGVILFVDEMHRLMGMGSSSEAEKSPGAQMLKPALASGELTMLGATTLDEYREIEKDPAMERRFQPVNVPPLSVEATAEVLQKIRGKWESGAEVRIEEGAIQTAAPWAEKYLNGNLPDSAISLVDDAVSSARAESVGVVTEEDLSAVIEEQTGIKARSSGADLARLKELEGELQRRVVGQDEAAGTVAKTIQRRAALGDDKPASLLFLGPTGVGKTELAKALAQSLFGSESEMIRIDMSEFRDQNMTSRLTGASRGYKDSEQGGQLTEAVRQKPYSVVLLDEIEKAHNNVLTLLLQLLDEGRLTDGRGVEVDFKNTIVIMTSNVGAERIRAGERSAEAVSEELVRAGFLPELIGRMDERIVFTPLAEEDLKEIVGLLAKKPIERARSQHGVELSVHDSLADYIARTGKDPRFGARDLQKLVRTHVEEYLVERIIDGEIGGEDGAKRVELWYDAGEGCQYWYSPKEEPSREPTSEKTSPEPAGPEGN